MAKNSGNVELTELGRRMSERYRRTRAKFRRAKSQEIRANGLPPRKNISTQMKRDCLKKTNHKCHMCGKRLTISSVQIGHLKPRALGGKDVMGNYLPICKDCNRARWILHSKEMKEAVQLGVWARSEIERASSKTRCSRVGVLMANAYTKKKRKK